MGLPILKRFCVCMPLEAGGYITGTLSFLCCLANLSVGSWLLPYHKQQQNEDNVILMSMVMFSTLSAISNVAVLLGLMLKRPNYLQLSLLSNSVFILCIFLVAVVSCLFSPTLQPYLQSAGNIVLAVILLAAGAVYSLYYLTVVNSLYTKMKMMGSAIPV